jgi:hypothetical protein
MAIAFVAAMLHTHTATAQTSKEIVERSWHGTTTSTVEGTEIKLERVLNLTVINSDNMVRGTMTSTGTVNGKKYKGVGKIIGFYAPSKQELYISVESISQADVLPNNMRWCRGNVTLKLSKSSGDYKFSGKWEDECKNSMVITFED